MPRHVDHEARRHQIRQACLDVIAEVGARGLSFRAVAERMGGSTTLITHYYPSQTALVDDLAAGLVDSWAAELEQMDAASDDARQRLLNVVEWLLPLDPHRIKDERARINLLSENFLGDQHHHLFDAWDMRMRGFLREHVADVIDDEETITGIVDVLRALTNGVGLSVVEHPGDWPPDRQRAVVRRVLTALELAPAPVAHATTGTASPPERRPGRTRATRCRPLRGRVPFRSAAPAK